MDLKRLLAEWAEDFEEASKAMPTRLQKVILKTRAQECRDMLETLSEPYTWCFTDVNGRPNDFCEAPKHSCQGDLRIRTPLYKLEDL